jgi:hypothetical protein
LMTKTSELIKAESDMDAMDRYYSNKWNQEY